MAAHPVDAARLQELEMSDAKLAQEALASASHTGLSLKSRPSRRDPLSFARARHNNSEKTIMQVELKVNGNGRSAGQLLSTDGGCGCGLIVLTWG